MDDICNKKHINVAILFFPDSFGIHRSYSNSFIGTFGMLFLDYEIFIE
jgi:hypothetical protein